MKRRGLYFVRIHWRGQEVLPKKVTDQWIPVSVYDDFVALPALNDRGFHYQRIEKSIVREWGPKIETP